MRNAGITPRFANRKTPIAETERISASSCAVNAFLELAIRSASVSLGPDSDSGGMKCGQGAAHHRAVVDFVFGRGLRIVSCPATFCEPRHSSDRSYKLLIPQLLASIVLRLLSSYPSVFSEI